MRIGGSLKFLWNGRGRLKTKMERRRLVAKLAKYWRATELHWVSVYTSFRLPQTISSSKAA
ncbi:hypothetical protein [Kingella oralis]|uniref:hypothetical protein n=1 Tax=Kingella oralis TaxID=505 RepID=UPI0034E59992